MTKNYLFLLLGLRLQRVVLNDKDEQPIFSNQCCNACFGNSIQAR